MIPTLNLAPSGSPSSTGLGGGAGLPHRYWRIGNWLLQGAETTSEMPEIQPHVDGVDVKALATYSSARALTFGSFADWKDGNLTTRAFWNAPLNTQVLDFDFGASPVWLNGMKFGGFDTNTRYVSSFDISYSDDGSSYTLAWSKSGLTYPGNNTLSALISYP